jgi:hypothetical protein
MNCHTCEADLVDLARGVDLSAPIRAGVGEHLERCPACASRFALEQRLTAELRDLAASAPLAARSDALEQQLLRAFAARQDAASGQPAATPYPQVSRSVFSTPAAWRWLAAAAVLVLAVAGWIGSGWWRSERDTAAVSTPALTRPAELKRATAVVGGAPEAPVRTPPAEARSLRASPQSRPPRDGVSSTSPAGEDGVLRFVSLPAAAGLPALESGRIVRVALPMSLLPAYGLDVAPETAARVVEADVLVGQDGQPRAIRFVSLDPGSRRKQ